MFEEGGLAFELVADGTGNLVHATACALALRGRAVSC